MSKFARIGPVPEDFDVIGPTLNALEDELKRKSGEVPQGKSRAEANWLVPQIDWQRTRYVHDMYYKYERISQECFEYCVRNKIINGKLSEKWLEQGYERLCSLHAIDPRNFQFGGTSICRVPRWKLRDDQKEVVAIFNGCRGCASGKGAGSENIFGNKYGQRLAAIQIKREQHQAEEEEKRCREEEEERLRKALELEAEERDNKEKKTKKKHKNDKKDFQIGEAHILSGPVDIVEGATVEGDSKHEKKKKKKKDKEKDKDKDGGKSSVWAKSRAEEVEGLKDEDDEHIATVEAENPSKRLRAHEDSNQA